MKAIRRTMNFLLIVTAVSGVIFYSIPSALSAAGDDISPLIMNQLSGMYGGGGSKKMSGGVAVSIKDGGVVKALTDESGSDELTALNEVNKKKDKLVHIAIEVVEIRNQVARTLGIKWVNTISVGEISHTDSTRVPQTMTDVPALFTVGEFARWTAISADIQYLIDKGAARLLAQPKLIAKSNTNAFFTVGGQVPIAVNGGLGQTTIEWKEYGTRVYLLPTILDDNQIGLSIFSDVSDLDYTSGITASSMKYPGIIMRKTSSSVILKDGETLALAGLEKNLKEDTTTGVPLLCDIPLIGYLFSHKSYTNTTSTVVIFVTPTIVKEGVPVDTTPH